MAASRRIQFAVPPEKLRTGGLDTAIDGLAGALGTSGWEVEKTEEGEGMLDCDLLHIHGLWRPENARLARAARAKGIPYIVSPHGMLEPWARRSKRWKKALYFRLVERRVLSGAAAVLCTSRLESRNLAAYCPRLEPLLREIPLGADPAPELPSKGDCRNLLGLAKEERLLLYLSRIDRKKGLDLLLEALATTGGEGVDRLVVVGDGDASFLDELRSVERALAVPAITWAGAVWGEDKWRYLRAADLLCLPTHSENFGFVVLEALLADTPVLTTDGTPWADWGEDVEGLTICSPETLSVADGLARSRDGEGAAPGSLAGWARENFLWEKVVERYEALYRELAVGAAPACDAHSPEQVR